MTLRDDIRTVQRRLGITPDGIPGPLTFAAMNMALDDLANFRAAVNAAGIASQSQGPRTAGIAVSACGGQRGGK